MDWLDAYLDNLSDGRNVVFPPDSHVWKPARPTKKQQSLIQDSMVFDMQQLRLIQEARRDLEEHAFGDYSAGDANSPTGGGVNPFVLFMEIP